MGNRETLRNTKKNAVADGMEIAKTQATTPGGQYRFELGPLGELGRGGNGVVRLAQCVRTGQRVAVKIVSVENTQSVATEFITQGMLNHPHIVELKATLVDLDKRRVYLVMELCVGG